jgi:isoquinoline 1-oxidoreductase beta subunit
VCEVHVTPAGEVQLRRLVAAIDCGQAINPNSIEAQIEGGVVFGLSAALFNAITLTKGRVDQSNFNDYRQIRMNEVPPFEVHIVKSTADPGGVGEAGTVSAAPALGNAIFAATGIRLRQLPFAAAELMEKNADKSVIGVPTAAAVGIAAIAGAKFALDADAPGDEA